MISGQILDGKNIKQAVGLLQNGDVINVDIDIKNYNDGAILTSYTFGFERGILVIVNDSSYGGYITLKNGLSSGSPWLYRLTFARNNNDTVSSLEYTYLGVLSSTYDMNVHAYDISFIIAQ